MLNIEALTDALFLLSDWKVYLFIIVGIVYGLIMGAIPGISATLAIGLMLVPSMYMTPIQAIVFLSSVYTSAVYGGGVTATVFNMPGAPGAVATTFDGYQLTKKGRQNFALGLGLISSFIGVFISYGLLFFFMQPLGAFVLKFGPPEMLMIVLLALTIIGLVQGSFVKSLVAGFFGLLLGTIGMSTLGQPRGTFGFYELYDGLPLVPTVIGLFAISELFYLIKQNTLVTDDKEVSQRNKRTPSEFLKEIFEGFKEGLKHRMVLFKGSIIGVVVGLLPAAGSSIASLLSYSQVQESAKDKSQFGKGDPRGIVASETANNASEAGAMATTLAFSIPGGGAAAVLLSAFLMHGMIPGPYLVRDSMDFVYAFIISNFLQAIVLLLVGIIFIYYFARIVYVPTKLLIPAIFAMTVIGTYSIIQSMVYPFVALIFGVIGYIMRKLEYPVVSVVMGIILGSMVESEFLRTYRLFSDDLFAVFSRPLFTILFIGNILILIYIAVKKIKGAKANNEQNANI
ncbi:tripartite tricarboxylate transporter permease [Robertmurraya massiliosenegalensis]|uniref:tripartite tricarboxylate transporter permease n=1 Tax=Robertmurraya TaxID=2837507 RepID=UPI0039A5E31B